MKKKISYNAVELLCCDSFIASVKAPILLNLIY